MCNMQKILNWVLAAILIICGVIGTDQPNLPAGARQYNGGIDWDDWDE